MWPERSPGRGSGALPAKRSAERASTTWALSSASAMRTSSSSATAATFISAVNFLAFGLASPLSSARPSAFQHMNGFGAENPKRPPHPGRGKQWTVVVNDHRGVVVDAERADCVAELGRAWQHMRQLGRMVADRFYIEEHRARNMSVLIFGMSIAIMLRQEIGRVDHDDLRIAQMVGQPIRRHQPTAGLRSGRKIVVRHDLSDC